jgi:ArsR family transcriptional regulator
MGTERVPQPALSRDPDRARRVSEVLKAVAHPLRIRIVALLAEGDEHVTGLSEKLSAPQAIVSQQLRILRAQGLVDAVREKGFARYRLVEKSLRTLVACMETCSR